MRPIVPDVLDITPMPGMPPLLFGPNPLTGRPAVDYVSTANPAPVALVADALEAISALGPPAWGIYQGGVPVVIADSVLDLGYSKAYVISDYPVEQGSYESYDKIETPFEARVRFVAGGSLANREALIESLEAIIGDRQFYEVATPEKIYFNANLVRQEYKREQGGVLTIEVSLQEVRAPTSSSAWNPSDPASANPVNLGTVRSTPATNAQIAAAGGTPVTTPAGSGGIGSA